MYDYVDDSSCVAIDFDQFLMMQDEFEEEDDNDGAIYIVKDDFFDEK